ncbi:embryonic polarity protein dorsal-like isoform X2 [Nasonia vitripennis]|uniref:RHD domain-containing protein n=1 Tax=Nasonia vitripennis TaxID=7425 RepID=A0A7M7HAP8_NASVI|nr:embryonic polarity protein dorsal-like isoform X2 [Nasonia vitripennis]
MEGDKSSSETQRFKPKIKIVVQPSNSRFGYKDEQRASFIQGSEAYPAIRIHNYRGPVTVIISCVTVDPPYKPHPCKLFNGNTMDKHGVCHIYVHRTKKQIHFKNLFVESVNVEDVVESLTERERKKVDPFKTGFAHKDSPEDISLNSVRLCFQVILHSFASGSIEVDPVVSDPIHNTCKRLNIKTLRKKTNYLNICYLSHNSATVAGGLKICILCERVPRNDIEVRFFHKDSKWEAFGRFVGPSIFQKVAIIIETPEFKTDTLSPESIKEPIEVNVQLKQPSNGHVSDPIPFQLLPLAESDYQSSETANGLSLKRKKSYYTKASSISTCKALQDEVLKDKDELLNDFPCEPWELPPVPPVTSSTRTTESSKLIPNISAAKLQSEELAAVINLYVEFLRGSSTCDSTGTPINFGEPCNSIEDVMELIDKDWNSSKTVSNPTDKSVLPYKPQINVSTISLPSNEVVNINEPNSNTKSDMQQMADSVHTEVTQPSYDLDDLILSELILDLNLNIEDIHLET